MVGSVKYMADLNLCFMLLTIFEYDNQFMTVLVKLTIL